MDIATNTLSQISEFMFIFIYFLFLKTFSGNLWKMWINYNHIFKKNFL